MYTCCVQLLVLSGQEAEAAAMAQPDVGHDQETGYVFDSPIPPGYV